ncbi:MAG: hypothetical protein JSW34_01040, partial [Candidatus Zixiibacteriota bacterium]
MLLKYAAGDMGDLAADSTVLFVPRFEKISGRTLKRLDEASSGAVTTLLKSAVFTGKVGEIAAVYHPHGLKSDRVILVGLGERKSLTADSFRRAA